MANENIINDYGFLREDGRVFLPSTDINIFPCSRRGQSTPEYTGQSLPFDFDPEARLNTERTNRLHTAINGFKDSFIASANFNADDGTYTLIFVLAGYRIEINKFDPVKIADTFEDGASTLYAYLRLHSGISLNVPDYFTEILYRQSKKSNSDINYLDVSYEVNDRKNDFFMGVSFVKTDAGKLDKNDYYLPLFSYSGSNWEPIQTSLLPKIEHGTTANSVVISELVVEGTTSTSTLNADTVISDTVTSNTVTSDIITTKTVTSNTVTTGTITSDSAEITEQISAPKLKVNTITSDLTEIAVNKKLTLGANTSITTPVANIHSALNVTNSTKTAKADIDILEADKAAIGDLDVKAGLNNSTGKITAYDLDVSTNIDTSTLKATTDIATPLLKTTNITSDSTEIVVDKVLKVDTINSDSTNGLTIKQATKLEKTLTANKKIIANNDIEVADNYEVDTPQLRVNRITSDGDTITIDDKNLVVNNKKVTAKEVAAEKITQNGKAIPAIGLVQNGTAYQLQITLDAAKK